MPRMTTVLTVLAAVILYEAARSVAVGAIARAMRRGATRYVRQNHIQLELARFVDRVWMRERIATDKGVEQAVFDANRRTGRSIGALREQVDAYVDEIAPYFSMASYYQFGHGVARRFVEFCFEVVLDPAAFDRQAAAVPDKAVRVYVINHRSNVDPMVIAWGLAQKIALSYAVGEWALVWPLSTLFRSFGSYFVRRGEPDPLYHAVLERFVQLLAGQGAVTGFFPEGGLSRDGALRKPRSGLLEYIIKLREEHPDKDIVFLPVGLNYDRVLEDRYLVAERDGHRPRPQLIVRLWNLVAMLFWTPILVFANLARYVTWAPPKFGYAAIAFGEPLKLSEWPGGPELHALPADQRKEAVRELARELLYRRIGRAVPAVPVAITCTALLQEGGMGLSDVYARVQRVVQALRAAGAPLALGPQFDALQERRRQRQQSLIPDLDTHIDDLDEAELIVMLSLAQMGRRRVARLRRHDRTVHIHDRAVVAYYANSLRHHLEPDWLDARDAPPPPS